MDHAKYSYQQTIRKENTERLCDVLCNLKAIQGDHFLPTAASLSEYTGISRQTLSTSYYRKIWDNHYQGNNNPKSGNENQEVNSQTIILLEKKVNDLNNKIKKEVEIKNTHKKNLNELKKNYNNLLFLNLSILRRMRLHGITLDDLELEYERLNIK